MGFFSFSLLPIHLSILQHFVRHSKNDSFQFPTVERFTFFCMIFLFNYFLFDSSLIWGIFHSFLFIVCIPSILKKIIFAQTQCNTWKTNLFCSSIYMRPTDRCKCNRSSTPAWWPISCQTLSSCDSLAISSTNTRTDRRFWTNSIQALTWFWCFCNSFVWSSIWAWTPAKSTNWPPTQLPYSISPTPLPSSSTWRWTTKTSIVHSTSGTNRTHIHCSPSPMLVTMQSLWPKCAEISIWLLA